MNRYFITKIAIALITCALTVFYTHKLLSQPPELTSADFFVMMTIAIAFISPFAGMLECLAFVYIRPQEFISGLHHIQLVLIIEGLTLVFMLLQMTKKKNYGMLLKVPQDYLMLWFFLAIGMSHLANFYMGGFTSALEKFASTLILYFLIVHLVDTPKKLKITLNLILVLTIFLAVQGIIQYHTGIGIGGQTAHTIGGFIRIQGLGIFSDPNDLGLAMLIMVPFIFFTYLDTKRAIKRLLMVIGFGLLGYAMFLTLSRGTILSLGLILVLLFTRKVGKIGVALGFAALFAIYVVGSGRLFDISVQEASSFGRVESWTIGFQLFKTHPLFGVGMGMFLDFHTHTAHNSFVLCAAELGLFGFFPWLMLFVTSMRNDRFIANQNFETSSGELKLIANSLLYGLVAFASAGFFLSRTYLELLFVLFALSVSVTNIFVLRSDSHYTLWEKIDVKYTFALMLGFFVVTYMFLRFAWLVH